MREAHEAFFLCLVVPTGGRLLRGPGEGPRKLIDGFTEDVGRGALRQHGAQHSRSVGLVAQKGEDVVVEVDDFGAAAPVARQRAGDAVSGDGQKFAIPQDGVEQGGISTAPAVDGLFDVSYPCETAPARQALDGKGLDGCPLVLAGILEFVDEDVRQPCAHAAERLGDPVFAIEHPARHLGQQLRRDLSLAQLIVGQPAGQRFGNAHKGHDGEGALQKPSACAEGGEGGHERREGTLRLCGGVAARSLVEALVEVRLMEIGRFGDFGER